MTQGERAPLPRAPHNGASLVVDTLDGAQARLARWKSAKAKDAGPMSATPAAGSKKLPEQKPAPPPPAPPH